MRLARTISLWVCVIMGGIAFAAGKAEQPKSDYGAKRVDFSVAGCDAFIIYPFEPAADGSKPWVWYAPTIGHHPSSANAWLLSRLLHNGFYVAGIYVGETFANPQSRAAFTEFYHHMVTHFGLSPKVCLLAQSRGGLNHYNWAADHPDQVQCIAGIFAVGDLRSFPGLKRAAPAYGLTVKELEAQLPQHNPIDRLAPIARAHIPILHIHGDADKVVPMEKNSQVIYERYRVLGGKMELVVAKGKGHQNDPGFFESERMLRFLLSQGRDLGAENLLFETTTVFGTTPDNRPNYRIPALVKAPNNDLLIFAEKRNHGPGDIGDTDIVMKRSSDRGRTWGDEQVLYDEGYETHTDCTAVLDKDTKKIWLFFLRDKKRFCAMWSADSGRTWSPPYSIHADVVKPEWDTLRSSVNRIAPTPPGANKVRTWEEDWSQRYGIGPGSAAIQLERGPKAGRLLIPARHIEPIGPKRFATVAHVFYSDDHGATFHLGPNALPYGSESQLVELANGDVMINARDADNRNRPDKLTRRIALSADGGQTWGEPYADPSLAEPQCHACIERYSTAATHGKDRLLFANPDSRVRDEAPPYGRRNLTVRLSYDEGKTWTSGKTIYPHSSSYSDIAVLDDMTIGIAYERGPEGGAHYWDEIQFARFNLEWLTDGKDSFDGR